MNAIPQTIIIDHDGKVVRHFIGGGTHFAKDLVDAVHGVTSPASPKPPATSRPRSQGDVIGTHLASSGSDGDAEPTMRIRTVLLFFCTLLAVFFVLSILIHYVHLASGT